MFQSSSTQNDFNSTEAELKISYLKPSDIKDLQTEEIKQAQIHIALLGWMLSCLENTWVWRRSKTKNHVGIDRQLFKETDFMHMWSCNMSSKRSHSKLHLFAFWPPGHFGTQTSYHSYCTATLWTFSRGKFSKGGWALPRQSLHVFLDCTAAKTQLMKHLGAEPKPSVSQAHSLHRGTLNMLSWVGIQSKVVFCATVHGGVWSSSLFKTSPVHCIFGIRHKMGQTKEQVQLLNSGT